MDKATQEEQLVVRAAHKDGIVLQKLVDRYYPMVKRTQRRYYLRDFDRQDWKQEALITCYEAVVLYTHEKGRFGSYFKRRFENHIRTLLRFNLAKRRRPYTESLSLEALQERAHYLLSYSGKEEMMTIPSAEVGRIFLANLSKVELIAFLTVVGKYHFEDALIIGRLQPIQLKRARARIYLKMRQALFNHV